MKKMVIAICFILFLIPFLFSQQTVGVLDISPRQGVSAVEAQIVTDFIYDALYRYGGGRLRGRCVRGTEDSFITCNPAGVGTVGINSTGSHNSHPLGCR